MNLMSRRNTHLPVRTGGPMQSLQQEIDRLFDQFVTGAGFGEANWLRPSATFYPDIDLQETESGIQLSAELPGMTDKDVEITVTENTLTVRGEKKTESERSGTGWRHTEREYGQFERVIALGTELDGEKAQASFRNGVLTVTVPRKEGVKRNVRKIKVSTEH
jgi:HSP20 family protein